MKRVQRAYGQGIIRPAGHTLSETGRVLRTASGGGRDGGRGRCKRTESGGGPRSAVLSLSRFKLRRIACACRRQDSRARSSAGSATLCATVW
eukprot:3969748-Pleurochrysis_carterae.AAC.1